MPSIFPFATKKSKPRRELVRVGRDQGHDESSHDREDEADETIDAGPSSENVDEPVEVRMQSEVNAELEAANDEIVKLKRMLDEARLEIVELRKSVGRKRFGIEVIRDSDKDVNFYTGLPSAAVFDSTSVQMENALMWSPA